MSVAFNAKGTTCNLCHISNPGPGTNLQVLPSTNKNTAVEQPIKVPHLRNMYQKTTTNFGAGAVRIIGFGYDHDGHINGLIEQISLGAFGTFSDNTADEEALEAFELCFGTGMAPAVGYARTLTNANVTTSPAQSD